jgi:outer membrane receptor for ferrienterochelin and colicin
LYTNSEFEYSFGTPTYGNANLNPEKTVSYELGLQQQLSDNIAFTLTGFYKDVRDLLATQRIRISSDEVYNTYVNKDYANIKGIVFSLTKRRNPNDILGFTLDYTFQVAEGNDVSSDAFFIDLASGRQSEKVPIYLNWDKSHQLNATVSFGDISNWNVTLVGKIGTGLPYTPQIFDKEIYLESNSDRRPVQSSVDLLAEKTFSFEGVDLVIFAKIYNLFDTMNENSVYSTTGRATYTLDETRGPAVAANELAARIPEVKTATEYYTRPDFYSPPREVRVGLSIEF